MEENDKFEARVVVYEDKGVPEAANCRRAKRASYVGMYQPSGVRWYVDTADLPLPYSCVVLDIPEQLKLGLCEGRDV